MIVTINVIAALFMPLWLFTGITIAGLNRSLLGCWHAGAPYSVVFWGAGTVVHDVPAMFRLCRRIFRREEMPPVRPWLLAFFIATGLWVAFAMVLITGVVRVSYR